MGCFRGALEAGTQQHFSSEELRELFAEFTGIIYSSGYFTQVLRQKLGMHYYKPCPRDYRRSENAEEQLRSRLQATFDALGAMGKDVSSMPIGFGDECGVQLHHNNARFWSLKSHQPKIMSGTQGAKKFFGFYALQGESLITEMHHSKAEDFKPILLALRTANAHPDGCILLWDNATSHKKVEQWAWQQGIYIIRIPPYSPDLNPIERVWKSCKRWVSLQGFCKKKERLVELFGQAFEIFKVQKSFAKGWCEKILSILSQKSTI